MRRVPREPFVQVRRQPQYTNREAHAIRRHAELLRRDIGARDAHRVSEVLQLDAGHRAHEAVVRVVVAGVPVAVADRPAAGRAVGRGGRGRVVLRDLLALRLLAEVGGRGGAVGVHPYLARAGVDGDVGGLRRCADRDLAGQHGNVLLYYLMPACLPSIT